MSGNPLQNRSVSNMKTKILDLGDRWMVNLVPENEEELKILVDSKLKQTYIGDDDDAFKKMRRALVFLKEKTVREEIQKLGNPFLSRFALNFGKAFKESGISVCVDENLDGAVSLRFIDNKGTVLHIDEDMFVGYEEVKEVDKNGQKRD